MSQDNDKKMLQQIPGYVLWKNTKSIYIGANYNFIKLVGLNLPEEIIGMTDFDMPWHSSHAKEYRQIDQEIFSGLAKTNYFETQLLPNNRLIQVIVNKVPLYSDAGEIIGLICNYNECKEPGFTPNKGHPDELKIENCYQLPKKQTTCLRYIVMGFTAKQIARKMELSPRTVESYTEILKTKLCCQSKYQLIQKVCREISGFCFKL